MSGGGRTPTPYRQIPADVWGPWRDRAQCARVVGVDFFPDPSDEVGQARAKLVCAACPVRKQCLDAHLAEPSGIFGGMNEQERWQERRRRSAAS